MKILLPMILTLAALLAIAGAACGDDDASPATPTSSAAETTPAATNLKPPDSELPAAGICAGAPASSPATVEFHVDVPAPRCQRVLPSTHIRLVNKIERTVDFQLGVFRGTLAPGADATSGLPAGEFLAPGVHGILSTAYGDGSSLVGSGELWLQAGASPAGGN
ncbi:MAG TPA: hypothetical protein VMT90_04835 [Dehalococcoidia bacterium]|nr:hypothetical protein [Dehalococcoidia bacterium]